MSNTDRNDAEMLTALMLAESVHHKLGSFDLSSDQRRMIVISPSKMVTFMSANASTMTNKLETVLSFLLVANVTKIVTLPTKPITVTGTYMLNKMIRKVFPEYSTHRPP